MRANNVNLVRGGAGGGGGGGGGSHWVNTGNGLESWKSINHWYAAFSIVFISCYIHSTGI